MEGVLEEVEAATTVGEEDEMEAEDEVVATVMSMVVNLEVSLHPRAVRKYMLVHNWTRIFLRTSATLESISPSMRTFQ